VFDEGRENDRFRDAIDILLVEDLVYDVGLDRMREACMDIFTVRDKHRWPPTVTVYDSWRVQFAALARENGFKPEDIDEAAAALTAHRRNQELDQCFLKALESMDRRPGVGPTMPASAPPRSGISGRKRR
jgi:hypothetical protein